MVTDLSCAFSKKELNVIYDTLESAAEFGYTNPVIEHKKEIIEGIRDKVETVVRDHVDFPERGFSEIKKELMKKYFGQKGAAMIRAGLKKLQPRIDNTGTSNETVEYPENYWEAKQLLVDIFGEIDTVHTTNEKVIEK